MKKEFETMAIMLTSYDGDMELSLISDAAVIPNKNLKTMKLIYIIAGFAMALCSCSKGLDPKPVNLVLASNQFATDSKANDAVVGLYSTMYSNDGYSSLYYSLDMPLYTGLSADELNTTLPGPYNAAPYFNSNSIPAINGDVEGLWAEGYNNIYQANAIIDNVSVSTGITAAGKAQFTGEAKFLRALNYFYLVNMFGGVPLAVTSDYHVTSKLPRASVADIYNQMVSDLTDATTLLTDTYYTTGRVRANKAAALALLARVYLYKSDWVNAEKEASLVIGDNNYALEPSYGNIFLSTSKEAIFQFYTSTGYTQYQNTAAVDVESFGTYYNYTLNPDFVNNAFKPLDSRKAAFIDSLNVNGTKVYYPYKYKNRTPSNTTEYYMCLRLAEQYLIRAEARAQQNNMAGAVADFNLIRTRSGLPGLTPDISLSNFLTEIEYERRAELCFEWGDRWFNLKRTGRADAVLGKVKAGWKSTDALYPVPYSEINNNPALVQNPGY